MLTNDARRISCDKVTCLEQINAARIGVICQSAVSKLPRYSVSLQNIQGSSTCFWEAMFPTCPIAMAVTIHTLPWKGLKKAPFLFLVWQHPWFSFSGMVWTEKEFCQASGDFSLEQVGIDVSAPCTQESNSLDDNPAKHARMKKTRSLCVM